MRYFCSHYRKFFHIKAQLFVYMIQQRPVAKVLVSLALILICSYNNQIFGQPNGQALFSSNCASCHAVYKDLTGPALAGVEQRWGDKKKLHAWIRNNQAFLKTGDKYANELYLKYNKTQMNLFPSLIRWRDRCNFSLHQISTPSWKQCRWWWWRQYSI